MMSRQLWLTGADVVGTLNTFSMKRTRAAELVITADYIPWVFLR